jgi:hypothetical protein
MRWFRIEVAGVFCAEGFAQAAADRHALRCVMSTSANLVENLAPLPAEDALGRRKSRMRPSPSTIAIGSAAADRIVVVRSSLS